MSGDTDFRVKLWHAAEHDFQQAVALFETLGILIESNFAVLDEIDFNTLNMLSVQHAVAIERLRAASAQLYPPNSPAPALVDPASAFRCGYAAGVREAGKDQ